MRVLLVYGWGCAAMTAPAPAQARSLTFTIPGRIGGKGRPRGFIRGGKVAMFTPKQTVSDEGTVRHFASQEMRRRKLALLIGPLSLIITVLHRTPASWSKKRAAAARWITGKPDVDNTVKLIADALNGITWSDDAQIALLTMQRLYDNERAECVIVAIREMT